MFQLRVAAVILLLAAAAGMAKTPADSTTVCDRYQQSDMVFTGSPDTTWIAMLDTHKSPIHKRSEKSKRVRFLVREWYKGQRRNILDVWMTPSDCPLRIETDQTYLIYARLDKDNGRIESNACMGTIPVANAVSDTNYLTAAQLGPEHATRILGSAAGPALNIQAKSGIDVRYAVTDASGKFTFDGLAAGDWDLSVLQGTPKSVHLAPNSCVTVDLSTQ